MSPTGVDGNTSQRGGLRPPLSQSCQPPKHASSGRTPSLSSQCRQLEPLASHGHPDATESGSPGEYFGESSTFNFMAKVTSPDSTNASAAGLTERGSQNIRHRTNQDASARGSSLHLHPDLLAASSPSTVVFEELLGIGGGASNPFELPQRQLADKLVASYFTHRHHLSPYLHEGTFRERYERLWLSQEAGGEEATSANVVWIGLVNIVFAFGSEHGAVPGQMGPLSGLSAGFTSTFGRSSSDRDRGRFFSESEDPGAIRNTADRED